MNNKIIIDIGTHKCEELKIILSPGKEELINYLNWFYYYSKYLCKKLLDQNLKFNEYGYIKTPTQIDLDTHLKIMRIFFDNKKKYKNLTIISIDPNKNLVVKNSSDLKLLTKFYFFNNVIIENNSKKNEMKCKLYFNNSTLSSSLFLKSEKKKYKIVNGFKMQTLVDKLIKKKLLNKRSKVLLRINCEGVEDDVIKILTKNFGKNFDLILGSINDVKKIKGIQSYKKIKKFLINKKIKYSYFKGTDPSTWINNILKFNRFINEKN